MIAPPDHNRIIAAAAKAVLAPIGCIRKGRSRTWLDDHEWWVGVIEFQPSAWSRGSYLNVGACWLWDEKDYFSFDYGARDHDARVEPFQEFKTTEEFSDSARFLAEQAKVEVVRLRERFKTIRDVARNLCRNSSLGIWDNYHAGVASGIIGDVLIAKTKFAGVFNEDSETAWIKKLKTRCAELAA